MILVSQALRQVPCQQYDGVLRDWFKQHADFFMNSPQGKSAATYPNNVGMWYAAGVSANHSCPARWRLTDHSSRRTSRTPIRPRRRRTRARR